MPRKFTFIPYVAEVEATTEIIKVMLEHLQSKEYISKYNSNEVEYPEEIMFHLMKLWERQFENIADDFYKCFDSQIKKKD